MATRSLRVAERRQGVAADALELGDLGRILFLPAPDRGRGVYDLGGDLAHLLPRRRAIEELDQLDRGATGVSAHVFVAQAEVVGAEEAGSVVRRRQIDAGPEEDRGEGA